MSERDFQGFLSRILNDPKLMTLCVAGAAFLGVTVWAISMVSGDGKPHDEAIASAKLPLSAPERPRLKVKKKSDAHVSHLGVKKLRKSRLPASVVTADSLEEEGDETRDASSDATGTLEEVQAMQLEAQRMAELHGEPSDSSAEVKRENRASDRGSFEMISKLGNKDYVAAGAAAIAADTQGVREGPISKEQAKTIKISAASGKKPAAKSAQRSFRGGQAGAGGGTPSSSGGGGAHAAAPRSGKTSGSTASAGGSGQIAAAFPNAAAARGASSAGPGGAASRGASLGGGMGGMGGGAGGGGGRGTGRGVAPAKKKEKEKPPKPKSWRAIEGQASDFLVVADYYHQKVVTKITELEEKSVPSIKANLLAADAVLGALEQEVQNATIRYRNDPEAAAAVADIDDIIQIQQRPKLQSASTEIGASVGEIRKVPPLCRRYVSHWETVYYNKGGYNDDGYSYYQRRQLQKQGWHRGGSGRWSKTVERRTPIDPRAGALAAHSRLTAALSDAQHASQYAQITADMVERDLPGIVAGMSDEAAAAAFRAFGETVREQMLRVRALVPASLMVQRFDGDVEGIQEGALKGRKKIHGLNERAKKDNPRVPQTRDLAMMQGNLTDAAWNSNEALSHANTTGESLFALVRTGETATAAYIDVCDARLRLLNLTKTAKK